MGQPNRTKNLCWIEIQQYYDEGNTLAETAKYFNISGMTLTRAGKIGKFIARSYSESAKISIKKYPRKFTIDSRKKLRLAMLLRRKNGYNWTLSHSTNNRTKKSYPEKFWTLVIDNEFDDKDYQFNLPFKRFSLDFAWVHKKKVIEIDGEQHYTQETQKLRDIEKDKLLKENGWELLRLRWKDVFKNSKYWINIANTFVVR